MVVDQATDFVEDLFLAATRCGPLRRNYWLGRGVRALTEEAGDPHAHGQAGVRRRGSCDSRDVQTQAAGGLGVRCSRRQRFRPAERALMSAAIEFMPCSSDAIRLSTSAASPAWTDVSPIPSRSRTVQFKLRKERGGPPRDGLRGLSRPGQAPANPLPSPRVP